MKTRFLLCLFVLCLSMLGLVFFFSQVSAVSNRLGGVSAEFQSDPFANKYSLSDTSQPPIYRIAVQVEQNTNNIWKIKHDSNTNWNSYPNDILYLSLYRYSSQFHKLVPYMAAEFPSDIVKQGSYWVGTVSLRQGVKWSNGSEVTATDFLFVYEAYKQLGLAGEWKVLGNPLHHVEVLDPYSLKFYFSSPPGLFIWPYGIGGVPILSQQYWDPVLNQALQHSDPLDWFFGYNPSDEPTNGPFMRYEWLQGSYVELVANTYYYFKGLEVTEYSNGAYRETLPGRYTFTAYGDASGAVDVKYTEGPYVSNLKFITSGSADSGAQMVLNNQADTFLRTGAITSSNRNALLNDPNIGRIENLPNGFRYLSFNNRRSVLGKVEFHQAVALLTDKEYIADDIYSGSIDPLYSFILENNTYWYTPTVHIGEALTREQRIDQTVSLLSTANFTWTVQPQWDPIGEVVIPGEGLHYNGQPVPTFELIAPGYAYDPIRATFATYITQWLNEAGISTTLTLLDWDTLTSRVFIQQDFDMFILGWNLGYTPEYLCDFFTSQQASPSGNNAGGYENPIFDLKCSDFSTTTEWDDAQQLMYDIQDILANDLPYVLLFTANVEDFYRSDRVFYPYTKLLNGLSAQSGMPQLVQLVSTEQTISTSGGTLDGPGVSITFPKNSFDQPVKVTYSTSSVVVDLPSPGIIFDLEATYVSNGKPATLQPGKTYTIQVAYEEAALPAGVNEATLALYYWDDAGLKWVVEATSSVDTSLNIITATPNHLSTWGLFGKLEKSGLFLPIIKK